MTARRKARLVPAGRLTTREKLWTAMRELKRFTVPELARAAGVDRHAYNVRDYLLGLVHGLTSCLILIDYDYTPNADKSQTIR